MLSTSRALHQYFLIADLPNVIHSKELAFEKDPLSHWIRDTEVFLVIHCGRGIYSLVRLLGFS